MTQNKVESHLDELENLIDTTFPTICHFDKMPFAVEDRKNVGLSLSVRNSYGSKMMTVDIAYDQSDSKFNLVLVNEKSIPSGSEDKLRKVAEDYLDSHSIPYNTFN